MTRYPSICSLQISTTIGHSRNETSQQISTKTFCVCSFNDIISIFFKNWHMTSSNLLRALNTFISPFFFVKATSGATGDSLVICSSWWETKMRWCFDPRVKCSFRMMILSLERRVFKVNLQRRGPWYRAFDTTWWDRDGRSEIPSRSKWPAGRVWDAPVINHRMALESESSNKSALNR